MNAKGCHVPKVADYVKTLTALTCVPVMLDIQVMDTTAQVMTTLCLKHSSRKWLFPGTFYVHGRWKCAFQGFFILSAGNNYFWSRRNTILEIKAKPLWRPTNGWWQEKVLQSAGPHGISFNNQSTPSASNNDFCVRTNRVWICTKPFMHV